VGRSPPSGGWSIAGIPNDIPMRGLFTIALLVMTLTIAIASDAFASEGQMTWALHFSPTPMWFLARSARAVGRGVRHRPPGDEPGRAARLRQDHLEPGAPSFEFYWQPPGYAYDPVKAKQFLADAGYPNGFDAGDYFCDASLAYMGEPVVN